MKRCAKKTPKEKCIFVCILCGLIDRILCRIPIDENGRAISGFIAGRYEAYIKNSSVEIDTAQSEINSRITFANEQILQFDEIDVELLYRTPENLRKRRKGKMVTSNIASLFEVNNSVKAIHVKLHIGLDNHNAELAYLVFIAFAVASDYLSIQPFQDRILRGDEQVRYVLTAALIFCIDVIAPLTFPNLLQTHFNQKKLKFITFVSIISSVGLLISLNLIQKIVRANIMIPNVGEEVVAGNWLKLITLILYAIVPLTSTIALTVISLQRDNYKIYQMMRYCVLAETDVEVQLN